MSSRILLALSTTFVIGCGNVKPEETTPPDANTAATNDAPADPATDGGLDAAPVCAASTALRCEGSTLVSCNELGTAEVPTGCALRCNATTLACEDRVDPSNGFAAQLDAAIGQPALTINQNVVFSTTTDFNATNGTIAVGGQQVKATLVAGAGGAPDVVVLSVGTLTVASGAKLSVFGDRAVAFTSAGDVRIAGTLEVRAGSATTADACLGINSGATGADNDVPGAGGGGFGQAGGNGGTVLGIGAGKAGGGATGSGSLIPLRGGCSGGTDSLGGGGGGGGAGQLASATTILVTGTISANGTGGTVSAGGGSGGGLLLEAPTVEVSGGVFANGGGGGCGGFSSGASGSNSLAPALGADCGGSPGTASGGNGGAGSTAATNGGASTNRTGSIDRAGGGGGAVGRIRINTLDASLAGSGAQSPPASVGLVAGR